MDAYRSSGDPLETAARLKPLVDQVMQVSALTYGNPEKGYAVRFTGRLYGDPAAAYEQLEAGFRPLDFTPLFRKEEEQHLILAVPGVVQPRPSNPALNLVLFALTVLTMLLSGALYDYGGPEPTGLAEYLRLLPSGWPFAVSLGAILLAHEFGHYVAARRSGAAVTLPFFLPLPFSPFGTLGAFIMLKAPPRNRRVLLDIGISGPLAGLVVALPILFIGLMTAKVEAIPALIPAGTSYSFEGNSLLYLAAKFAIFREWLPAPAGFGGQAPLLFWLKYFFTGLPAPLGGHDVILNQVAWAGWAGLLVTGLNLIPAGQLDGGHALYVLIGKRVNRLLPFILIALVLLGLVWNGWFLWALLIFFLGRAHAEPLDQITELDPDRRLLAILALVIFLLVFTPIPLRAFFGA
ncbi:MAG: site-2 protease family protein [Chloroflexi bacterium]|nr:site-2 protease family protein [Chloroflexota bacterium]